MQLSDLHILIQKTLEATYRAHHQDSRYAELFVGWPEITQAYPVVSPTTRYGVYWEVSYVRPLNNQLAQPSEYSTLIQVSLADWGDKHQEETTYSALFDLASLFALLGHPSYWQQVATKMHAIPKPDPQDEEATAEYESEVMRGAYTISKVAYELLVSNQKAAVKSAQLLFTLTFQID